MKETNKFYMKTKMLTLALAAFSLLACKNESMKPQSGYIGPADLKIEDGRMTPEVLLSLGRLSDPQLSPDGKTILYGVSYTSIADNRSVRNLFTLPRIWECRPPFQDAGSTKYMG